MAWPVPVPGPCCEVQCSAVKCSDATAIGAMEPAWCDDPNTNTRYCAPRGLFTLPWIRAGLPACACGALLAAAALLGITWEGLRRAEPSGGAVGAVGPIELRCLATPPPSAPAGPNLPFPAPSALYIPPSPLDSSFVEHSFKRSFIQLSIDHLIHSFIHSFIWNHVVRQHSPHVGMNEYK